eukprot:2777739-Prymnesium_polylepis.1
MAPFTPTGVPAGVRDPPSKGVIKLTNRRQHCAQPSPVGPRCGRTHTVRTQSERAAGVRVCERWQVRRRLTCLSATEGCTQRQR